MGEHDRRLGLVANDAVDRWGVLQWLDAVGVNWVFLLGWYHLLSLPIQWIVFVPDVLVAGCEILSFWIHDVHVHYPVWNKQLFLCCVSLNCLKSLIEVWCIAVHSLTEVNREPSRFTFILNQPSNGLYHGCLICLYCNILDSHFLLMSSSWSYEHWPFDGRMVLCEIFIDPNFDFTIIVDSNHFICNLKGSQLIVTVLVSSEGFTQSIKRFLKSQLRKLIKTQRNPFSKNTQYLFTSAKWLGFRLFNKNRDAFHKSVILILSVLVDFDLLLEV